MTVSRRPRSSPSPASAVARPKLQPLVEALRVGDRPSPPAGDTPAEPASVAPAAAPGRADDRPKYLTLIRKEARLTAAQLSALGEVRRRLVQERADRTAEPITDNTLIRVAVDLLLDRADLLHGSTEEDIRRSAFLGAD